MAKNPLSEARRAELKEKTRDLAASILEDLQHVREVSLRQNPDKGEIRRLSAVLRRLVTDDELNLAAAPRTGRVKVLQPDTKSLLKLSEQNPFEFFCTGGGSVFGLTAACLMVHRGAPTSYQNFDPDARVEVDLGSFVKQPVLCIGGRWATRGAVITYVANVASGVHTKRPLTAADETIRYARGAVKISIADGVPSILFNPQKMFRSTDEPLSYDPSAIDPALIEILGSATFLVSSPGITALEQSIQSELGITPSAEASKNAK